MDKERGAPVNKIAGVRFKKAGKIYYFSSENLEVNIDDGVIVETSRGMEYGRVVIFPKHPEIPGDPGELRPILRKATARDLVQVEPGKRKGSISDLSGQDKKIKMQNEASPCGIHV